MERQLNREQRDALHAAAMLSLEAIRDIDTALDAKDFEQVRAYRVRFEDDCRLLDDLGWEEDADREHYRLTMPDEQLERTLRHLRRQGEELLADDVEPRRLLRMQAFFEKHYGREMTAEEAAEFEAHHEELADTDLELISICNAVLKEAVA